MQLAEEQLILQGEHNQLLRELLTKLIEQGEVSASTAEESSG
ncbi:MAG: hypothetical protein R2932_00045 [Caldilineaceae bacterium]